MFSGALWFLSKNSSYKYLTFMWFGNLINFFSQGYFAGNDFLMGLSLSTYYISSISLISVYAVSNELSDKIPYKKLNYIMLSMIILSCFLEYFFHSFTISTIPIAFGITYPFLYFSFKELLSNWKKLPRFDKVFCILIVLNSVHFLDYPFLRKNEAFAPIGFSIAFAFMLCFALFLPAFIERSLKKQHIAELEARVKERTALLEKTMYEKEQLVNVLCHDIANPVSGIMLASKRADSKSEKKLEKIQKLSKRIGLCLEKVRKMSSIEAGKETLSLAPVSPDSIYLNTKEIFEEQLKDKNITLKYANDVDKDIFILADEICLSQSVVANLVSNAIKFTPTGGEISILVSGVGDLIKLSVKDSGEGMSYEQIEKIRGDNFEIGLGTDGEKGTGLGLSVAKFYIKKFNGTLEINSKQRQKFPNNCGTEFSILLQKAYFSKGYVA